MYILVKRVICTTFALSLLLAAVSWAEEKKTVKYPTKPVELIVPWLPGGGSDIVGRLLAAFASKKFGVPVNVVNVIGASGITGTLQALRAAPDGYTLLLDGLSSSSLMFVSRSDLPLKVEDRTFVCGATREYFYFICNVGTGWNTLEETLQFARSRPNEFKWAAGAYGATPMYAQLLLFEAARIDLSKTKMVIFEKGGAAALQACITGDTLFGLQLSDSLIGGLATGKIRVLATTAPERTKEYPDVPTTKEVGYPQASLVGWYGITGPKGLPDYVVKAWDDLVREAIGDPDFKEKAATSKKILEYLQSSELKTRVLQDYERFFRIATSSGIRK